MEGFKPRRGASHYSRLDTRANERQHNETKEALLASFKVLVEEEIKKDKNFNITTKFIKQMVKLRPELFLGIKTDSGVMKYFSHDINFLREQLDLPKARGGRVYL